ncbi:phosphodiesterase [Georgenia sp. TF02-10]|uniref:phosphodiesterase n=1 Tax=Georgenia sp. TF02-10 TaxID=2917725 RepID=UPI001FA7DF37|nr:phosphodiesterase [Georgenia sp. TF02-10]UNX54771.1 phosphodiesterase [Georgenia sp. TF02-10]
MATVARVRRSKPLHPRGAVVPARLELAGAGPAVGALGEARSLEAVARVSRATGLPSGWPDIQGLAVRWHDQGRPNDLLLASTGTGRWGRYLLRPRRRPLAGPLTTLMPFAGPDGPVYLAALPAHQPLRLALRWAGPRGPWHPLGRLVLLADPAAAPDRLIRFDPVEHSPAGLPPYPWAARLRRYAYRWSRLAWP